jgi:pantothenate kinase
MFAFCSGFIPNLLCILLLTTGNGRDQKNQHYNTNNNMMKDSHNSNNNNYNYKDDDPMEDTYRRLVDKLQTKLQQQQTSRDVNDNDSPHQYWIGIAGGPGSGKSTVAQAIADRLNKKNIDNKKNNDDSDLAVVIPVDGWHTPSEDLWKQHGPEGMKRRGAPWTFDVDLCFQQLRQAKNQGQASLPVYSRTISNPVSNGVTLLQSHKIVLVEGLYVLWKKDDVVDQQQNQWGKLWELWDETWFVSCPSRDEQIERLVGRSLPTWSDAKAEMWGPGEVGARKRAEYNDVQNMEIVEQCRDYADELIVTKSYSNSK